MAKLIPFAMGGVVADDEDKELEAAGIMRLPAEELNVAELLAMPKAVGRGKGLLALLLEEREEGR